MKKLCSFFIIFTIAFSNLFVYAKEYEIKATSYILMDADSGKIILEKNSDEKLPPASITKIMTLLLTMEAIDDGRIKESDIVTISKNAAIKTGSHVYLSEGEKITIEELLKSVVVSSANDASIALAEYISGTQENFVKTMNYKAKELEMKNTNFINCNGLDAEGHLSTARDIAIMTKELLKHKKILNYTTIWMDTIRNGEFGLSNTNKLIRFYKGANGMKTGSTSKAGCCLSATAKRENMQLIAVVLNAPTSKDRFADASELLNYGFNNYENIEFNKKGQIYKYINVNNGEKEIVKTVYEINSSGTVTKNNKDKIKTIEEIPDVLCAPIKKGEVIGKIRYMLNDQVVSEVKVVSDEDVKSVSYYFLLKRIAKSFIEII